MSVALYLLKSENCSHFGNKVGQDNADIMVDEMQSSFVQAL